MTIAVLRFPGTNNEIDVLRALSLIDGADAILVPSRKGLAGLEEADAVIIPGGFSYGDYLRAGAVASVEAITEGVRDLAEDGKPVIGICNGFQILTEMGLLPGALLPNMSARFICKWVYLKVSDCPTIFTEGLEGSVIRVPIAHAEGNYYCSDDELESLKDELRIPFRYCNEDGEVDNAHNPNGSIDNIAGIINQKGNVLGLMPHPERASRPVLGSSDGLAILENFVRAIL
ncbi:phosphoribosylformylglycinamidine synthase I [Candidatus Thorarchaeota archaeon]|nr:phosphoribosylformylglycinamidine synthase I [Candidatus Thorarchaeota archaeon]TFG99539.1 MAG: phosphoribosylformylglycinamidine synthase I [Candidatus Thorarchaeota archaeon]